ncbi:MAG TPA: 3-deoxy-D-manno-octulosonic acid transferase [Desulfomonilia bacterium]|nr:3-deoxy-D-manno-octulosonic acid transferase [Desulfomonilia bacterium]
MASLGLCIYRLLAVILVWPLAFFLRDHPNFQGTLAQRLGFSLPAVPPGRKTIWVHAASVGEVKAASGLIGAVRKQWPDIFILLTSMTATGRDVAGKLPEVDLVFPFPFDLSWVMKRYLLRLMPSAILIVETEIWPNMLTKAQDLAVPAVFVNARMSLDSFRRYRGFSWILKAILEPVRVLAMSGPDAERFSALGASRVEVLGNLKFDAVPAPGSIDVSSLRETIGAGTKPVFIAGSVREGEEAYVMDAVKKASEQIPGLLSIVAPRHPDRVKLIAQLASEKGLSCSLRSEGPSSGRVLIIDTMGELFRLYGISDAAFVGGSLVALGGQNILEPVAWGVPTIHGPHMENFTWALDIVRDCTYLVQDARGLEETLIAILKDPAGSRRKGREALDALLRVQGVTGRYIQAIEPLL